jgi:hypothetical protein
MAQNSLDAPLYTCCARCEVAFAPSCTCPQLVPSNYEKLHCTEITRSSGVVTVHQKNGHTFCSCQLACIRAIKSQKREKHCVSPIHLTILSVHCSATTEYDSDHMHLLLGMYSTLVNSQRMATYCKHGC